MAVGSERLERAGALVSFAVPFAVALAHLGSASQWRGDLALLRGLAWVGISGQGTLSALFIRFVALLPLGSTTFRAAVTSAAALGAMGAATYLVARRLLEANVRTPRLAVALSGIAALAATLGTSGQREGTVAGGAALGVALTLFALVLSERMADARGAARVGALAGALGTESLVLSVLLLASLASSWVVQRKTPPRNVALAFFGSAALSASMLLLPLAVEPWAPSF